MEFNFRAVDDSRTPPSSRSSPLTMASTSGCISEQGLHLRASNTTTPYLMQSQGDFCTIQREIEKLRIRQEIIAAETVHRQVLEEEVRRELMMEKEIAMYRASEVGRLIGPLPRPTEFYIIPREIEKERIRQAMLAAEIVHRRVLEEEARRELMMQREMAVHQTSEMGLSINERLNLQFHLRYPSMYQLEGGSGFPGDCGQGFRHDALPITFPQFSDAVRDRSMSASEVNKKDRLIILPRPQPNLCGTRQKASTPPSGLVEPPVMSSKIPKEWSCALCQVSTSSARGLHDHLQGKKHKAKEAACVTQNICKNSSALQQNKPAKQINVTERRDTAEVEMETNVDGESIQDEKSVDYLNQKKEDAKTKHDGLPKQKDLHVENQESENVIPTEKKGKKKRAFRKKLQLKVDEQSPQAEKSADFLNQEKEDSKNKNEELPKQKDLKAENQENKQWIPKVDVQSLQAEKTADLLNQKKEDSKNKSEELPTQKDLNAENQENENEIPTEKEGKKKRACRKKLKLKVDMQLPQAEKAVGLLNQNKEDSKNQNEELPNQKDLNAGKQENKKEIPTEKKGKKKRACRNKLKLKVHLQSLQAGKSKDFWKQKKKDSKNKNGELPKQKDLNAENQKNGNGMPALKSEKTKAVHKKLWTAKSQKNENGMLAAERGKTKQAHNKKLKLKIGEESLKAEKTVDYSNLKKEDSNNKNKEPPKQKDLNAENHKKKNGMLTAKRGKTKQTNRKKLKIWCEICQVGANSVVVMKAHKKGKRHMAHLKKSESKC